jgi:hypothetical protein
MDQDDDVEHLFSWLQTPELRYREFAGAREITDTIVTWQPRPEAADTPVAPSGNVQLAEEYPPDQFPDQTYAPVDIVERSPMVGRATVIERATVVERSTVERSTVVERGATVEHSPAIIAPVLMPSPEPPSPAGAEGLFGLGAAGRANLQEPVVRPPLIQVPAPRQAPAPAAPVPLPQPVAAPVAGGGLLGGTYRQNGVEGHAAEPGAASAPLTSAESQHRTERSLDAVFGRLADARSRLPDPRERLRHVPGLGPPPGRTR